VRNAKESGGGGGGGGVVAANCFLFLPDNGGVKSTHQPTNPPTTHSINKKVS